MHRISAPATIVVVGVIAAAAAAGVTASWEFARDRILANQRGRLLASLATVLDSDLEGDDLNPVLIAAEDAALLGSDGPIEVFVPLRGREPVAAIFATIAPHGYNAPIQLLIGIDAASARVTGVRVISHKETPGLGDPIDIRKSDWILQFDGRSLNDPEAARWKVDKDEGEFDSLTGATVTSRAIVEAVHNTLLYFDAHRETLFARALAALDDRDSPGTE